MTTNTAPVAEDAVQSRIHSVSPHLVCADAAAAIDLYKKAFGAEELMRIPRPDGKLLHACLLINGSSILLVDEFPEMNATGPTRLGGSPVTIHLSVDDADAWVARAEKAGMKVVAPVEEMFWGDRYGVVQDPFGHVWSMATTVRTMTEEQVKEAIPAMTPQDRS